MYNVARVSAKINIQNEYHKVVICERIKDSVAGIEIFVQSQLVWANASSDFSYTSFARSAGGSYYFLVRGSGFSIVPPRRWIAIAGPMATDNIVIVNPQHCIGSTMISQLVARGVYIITNVPRSNMQYFSSATFPAPSSHRTRFNIIQFAIYICIIQFEHGDH